VFTDGSLVGATLDRNGLRPGRYLITDDGLVVLASEIGVLDVDPARVVRKGRLRPGRMFLVDTEAGRLITDDEIKSELASLESWGAWLDEGRINLKDLPEREHIVHTPASVTRRQRTFGYTEEGCASFSRRWRRTRPSLSERWARTRRWPSSRIGRASCSTTSPSSSPR
jgi:glutamate synthase (NADPH/NADH) large chain